MQTHQKRCSLSITPEQKAEIAWLKEVMDASSAKAVILSAVRVSSVLVREMRRGNEVYLEGEAGSRKRLMPGLGWAEADSRENAPKEGG